MILLDTNVLSEILKPAPAESVVDWLSKIPRSQLFTTAITQAEILFGVALLPKGKRQKNLAEAIEKIFAEVFQDGILPFDSGSAQAYAEIASARRSLGRPISQLDAQIAAIARVHGATLASRNTADFDGCGVRIANPWS